MITEYFNIADFQYRQITESHETGHFSNMDSLARIAANPSSPTALAELATIAKALQAQPATSTNSEEERRPLLAEISKLDSILAPSVTAIADLIHDLNIMRK